MPKSIAGDKNEEDKTPLQKIQAGFKTREEIEKKKEEARRRKWKGDNNGK